MAQHELDPAKISPQFCGCGFSDVDTDADGIADCNDKCPADALNGANNNGICDGSETTDNSTTPDDAGTGTPTPGVSPAPSGPTVQVQGSGGSCNLNSQASFQDAGIVVMLMLLALAGLRVKGFGVRD
ncbi:hypothetical protein K1X76_01455 [bacterium]|nr:hypothetical protein [bacterium]